MSVIFPIWTKGLIVIISEPVVQKMFSETEEFIHR